MGKFNVGDVVRLRQDTVLSTDVKNQGKDFVLRNPKGAIIDMGWQRNGTYAIQVDFLNEEQFPVIFDENGILSGHPSSGIEIYVVPFIEDQPRIYVLANLGTYKETYGPFVNRRCAEVHVSHKKMLMKVPRDTHFEYIKTTSELKC